MSAGTSSTRRSAARWLGAVAATGMIVVAVVAWGGPEPPASEQPPGPDRRPEEAVSDAPPEAVLFREVFAVDDAVFGDGVWYVLDRRGKQIHGLSPGGSHLGSFGREGEGPGEFRNAVAVTIHSDTVVVPDGRTLHLFDAAGTHIVDRTVGLDMSCEINDAVSAWPSLLLLTECFDRLDMENKARVVVEEEDGSVRLVASRSMGAADPQLSTVVLGEHPRGFVFGSPYDGCLDLLGPSGDVLGSVCHDWIEPVPIPALSEEQTAKLAALQQRGRQLGIDVNMPEYLPPFDRVFTTVGDRLMYLAFLPDEAGKKLVTQADDGGATTIHMPAPILFAHGTEVLAAWEEREGMRIHFHTLEPPG